MIILFIQAACSPTTTNPLATIHRIPKIAEDVAGVMEAAAAEERIDSSDPMSRPVPGSSPTFTYSSGELRLRPAEHSNAMLPSFRSRHAGCIRCRRGCSYGFAAMVAGSFNSANSGRLLTAFGNFLTMLGNLPPTHGNTIRCFRASPANDDLRENRRILCFAASVISANLSPPP